MSQHCRANPCCGDRPCSGVPLPQDASGLPFHNKSRETALSAALSEQTLPVREYSHEDRVTLAGCLSWDLCEISPRDVKGILDRLDAEGYRLIRSAIVDVSAVEPEPVAWCQPDYEGKIHPRKFMVVYEDSEMGNAVFDDEAEAREHFEKASVAWNCHLFGLLPRAHPPRSALVDNSHASEAVDEWQPIVERLCSALDAAETYVIDGVTNAKQQLAMNEPYPSRRQRFERELNEAREIYAECQASRKQALSALSAARIADSAEAGGSATETKGGDQ